jgi:hypothetical protein
VYIVQASIKHCMKNIRYQVFLGSRRDLIPSDVSLSAADICCGSAQRMSTAEIASAPPTAVAAPNSSWRKKDPKMAAKTLPPPPPPRRP